MPQMMPMWWFFMFIFMTTMIMLYSCLLYFFTLNYSINPTNLSPKNKMKKWKWTW